MRLLPVSSPWSPAPVLYLPRTGSTMDDALRLWRQGYPGGTVVVAGYQERGRGRLPGRVWEAGAGRNLLFTAALDRLPDIPPQRLPVLAGLGVALWLEQDLGLCAQLKWPNDVLCRGRKLAGVLCESLAEAEQRLYLVGIGLNCNQRRFRTPLDSRVTSLALELGRPVGLWPLLEGILARLAACLEDPLWQHKLLQRLYGLGRSASILTAGSAVGGVVEGVAEDGALLLRPHRGISPLSVYSGELTLEPGPPEGQPGR